MALHWTLSSTSNVSSTIGPSPGHSTADLASPGLRKGKGPPLPLVQSMLFLMKALSFPQRHIASSRSSQCPPGTPDLICKAAFQFDLVRGVIPAQVQDFTFRLVEYHEIPVSPSLQPL